MNLMSSFSAAPLKRIAIAFIAALTLGLGGCSDDKEITTGGGDTGIGTDGGATSAQFAGTYQGTVTILLQGDSIDDETDTEDVTIVVRNDGTASMTISGETVEGTVNGDRIGFSVRREQRDGLLECNADAVVSGTIQSSSIVGSISGSGTCELVVGKTGITLSGSLVANKI